MKKICIKDNQFPSHNVHGIYLLQYTIKYIKLLNGDNQIIYIQNLSEKLNHRLKTGTTVSKFGVCLSYLLYTVSCDIKTAHPYSHSHSIKTDCSQYQREAN